MFEWHKKEHKSENIDVKCLFFSHLLSLHMKSALSFTEIALHSEVILKRKKKNKNLKFFGKNLFVILLQ